MINSDAEIALDYLLSPEFELINSAGKPLTGGYIEVYIHGTRNKYYCYSDWAGTLHPFQIPLDSLGSNIVLASPDNAYDVYVYNKYGSLIMSRYNVHCQGTGGGGGGSYVGDKLFYGQYTAHNVAEIASLSKAKGNINIDSNGYLQLKQGMSYHITVRGAFQVDDVANTETTLNYIEYSTISPIKVDIDFTKADPQNFELSYDIYDLAEDMAYQVAFEQINGMVTDLVVEVHSLSNLATTATFDYEAGDYISIVDNTISVTGINPEDYSTHSETYESIVTAIQLVTGIVTGIVPDDAATHGEVYEATVTAINFVTGIIPETQVQSDWDQSDDTAVDYIKNKPDLDIYATHDEVNESITTAINFVTGAIPTPEPELPLVAGDGITITEYEDRVEIAANVTSIDGYATESFVTGYVDQAISEIPEQVQSDWDQADDTQVDYIKNKPDLDIYATHGEVTSAVTSIDLSNYATNTEVYEATVTAVQVATGAIPEEEEVEFEEIDLNDYALASAIPVVTGYATHTDLIEAVSAVTGIGDYGQFYSTNITGAATMSRTKGTIEVTNDGKIKLKKGQSYHVTVRGVYNQTSPTNVYGDVSYIEYITGQPIRVNVDKTITEAQYFEISYDLYKLSNDSDYYVFLSMNGGTVNDLFIEIHAIGSVGVGGSGGGGGTEYDAGWGIQILNNVISVNPSIIPVVTGFATHDEVFESSVTAIQMVTGLIPEAQVQSDWTEADNTDPAYILNKPSEKSLVAGSGISITVDGTDVIISANVTGTPVVTGYVTDEELQDAVEFVTGLIPTDYATDEDIQNAVEFVTGLIPDTSSFATHAEVNNVSGAIVNEIPDVSDFVTEAQVTALLPEEEEVEFEEIDLSNYALASAIPTIQLNSDDQVTAINNYPLAGGGGGTSYTAGDGIDITNDVISLDQPLSLVAVSGIEISVSGDIATISASGILNILGDVETALANL